MSQQFKEVLLTMVIPELLLLQVQREQPRGDAVELDETLLRVAPEALDPVDVDLALGKDLPVVQPQVPVATEHEAIIAALDGRPVE